MSVLRRQAVRAAKWLYFAVAIAATAAAGTETATPPASETATPPASASETPPASETATPPASETATPPASETATPPASETATPPASETATPPASETATPPAPETATPPASGREAEIAATAAAIRAQLRTIGGGDWQAWSDRLDPFRRELAARMARTVPNDPTVPGPREARAKVLEGAGEPPLFECDPDFYLGYLVDRPKIARWKREREVVASIVAVSRWLAALRIDLVFVPVPKLTEVYPDHMAKATPADRIVAPQMRYLILDLAEKGVEVVDLLPEFLAARDASPLPLYEPCDPHWSETGRRLAVQRIASRLARYEFVRTAQAQPARFQVSPNPFPSDRYWACHGALTREQQARVAPLAVSEQTTLSAPVGTSPDDDAVLLLGDSYNGGLARLLKPALNLWVSEGFTAGGCLEAIKEFVRDPSLLAGRKVVVLVVSSWNVFAGDWRVPPPVAALGRGKDTDARSSPGTRR